MRTRDRETERERERERETERQSEQTDHRCVDLYLSAERLRETLETETETERD